MRIALLLLLAVCLLSTGCRGGQWWGLPPAGPLSQQQQRAVVHDPYAETGLGLGPVSAADDVRPREFQEGLSEPVKARIVPDAMPWAMGR